jgi:hypothetical protein
MYKAKWGMKEHIRLLKEKGLPVPPRESRPQSNHSKRRKDRA